MVKVGRRLAALLNVLHTFLDVCSVVMTLLREEGVGRVCLVIRRVV